MKKVVPEGLRVLLRRVKKEYGNPTVFITENGYSDEGDLKDTKRVDYFFSYMKEMLKAIYEDGCNVQAYTVWSLMDNFEWASGYRYFFVMATVQVIRSRHAHLKKYEPIRGHPCVVHLD